MRVWRSDADLMPRVYQQCLEGNVIAAAWVLEQMELEAEAMGLTP